eukprot:CAMPEP_0176118968 /NCGR_PEP_ID=MMETSP0120_2-20121206/59805_1 /TAXON_ID=160619 /ORGANISM="Kryptoperidinium foliaceum, Strain CCMP 1326" /LENGTH=61 /DNA_ID=CAMNT_0017453343 /DNA_START=100 /DNA_END=282 /DNA_ORIENTATION=-
MARIQETIAQRRREAAARSMEAPAEEDGNRAAPSSDPTAGWLGDAFGEGSAAVAPPAKRRR